MKQSKQFLFFTLTVLGFALLECLLTAILSPYLSESLFLSRTFPFVARVLAVIPPFLALGAAVEAIRVRGLGYSMIFIGIYAMIALLSQIPLSLISYTEDLSAPYALLLFTYMLSAAVTALLLFLALLLGYMLFMQNETTSEDTPILSLEGRDARVLLLVSAILTLYHLIRETIDIVGYIRDQMNIVSGDDVLSIILTICFFLALGVFCFVTGRVAGRLFPTSLPEEIGDEKDYV